jgi:hypothetical protein
MGLIPEHSNVPVVIDWLLNQLTIESIDAYIDLRDAPEPLNTASDAPKQPFTLRSAAHSLIKSAATYCPAAAAQLFACGLEGLPTDAQGDIDFDQALENARSVSINGAIRLLTIVEAQKIAERGGLLQSTVAAVRWAWEETPPCVPVTMMMYFGDVFANDTRSLEVAYGCARLGRKGEGLRSACRTMNYPQVSTICGSRRSVHSRTAPLWWCHVAFGCLVKCCRCDGCSKALGT